MSLFERLCSNTAKANDDVSNIIKEAPSMTEEQLKELIPKISQIMLDSSRKGLSSVEFTVFSIRCGGLIERTCEPLLDQHNQSSTPIGSISPFGRYSYYDKLFSVAICNWFHKIQSHVSNLQYNLNISQLQTLRKKANAMFIDFLNQICVKLRLYMEGISISVFDVETRKSTSEYERNAGIRLVWLPLNHEKQQNIINEIEKCEREWKDALSRLSELQRQVIIQQTEQKQTEQKNSESTTNSTTNTTTCKKAKIEN